MRSLLMVILLSSTLLGGCGASSPSPTPVPTAPPVSTKAFVLGAVDTDPASVVSSFQPLADYLAAQLGDPVITRGEVHVAPDVETMIRWLKAGSVDLFFESPYMATIVSDQSGAQPILRRWKDGVAEYHSVIFTKADSGITALAGLQGHTLGGEDNRATSGYLLPVTMLIKAGLKPVEKPSADAAVAPDEVGVVFTGQDANTVQWVLTGKITAGAVPASVLDGLPDASRTKLRVIGQSDNITRHLVLARSGMEATLLAHVKSLLVAMDKTPAGQAVLTTFENTARFDEFPNAATLGQIRALIQLLPRP